VLLHEPGEQRVVPKSPPETRRADDLRGAVQVPGDPEATLAGGSLKRLVPLPADRIRRRRPGAQEPGALARFGAVESGEPPTGKELARQVERSPLGLSAAHGDDRRSFGERVQPLGCRRHTRADDLDLLGIGMRLVGMHRPGVALELVRNRQPGMAGCEKDVREHAVAVELEAALDRAHTFHPRPVKALVPPRALPELRHVLQELRHRRVIAVANGLDERDNAAPPPGGTDRQARKGRWQTVAVALRAHTPLADRGGPAAPRGCRIGVRAEHRDLPRCEPPMPEGCIGDEAGEAAADDCARLRHGSGTPT
jgi:hypothetical protein